MRVALVVKSLWCFATRRPSFTINVESWEEGKRIAIERTRDITNAYAWWDDNHVVVYLP